MRIGINTRFLIENKLEGIGWFTFESMKRICKNHPEHDFYFFFDRAYSSEFIFSENVKPIVLFPPARHPLLYVWYFEFSIPRAIKKYNIDLFVSADGFIPTLFQTNSLAVIHDINFEHRPKDIPFLTRWYYKFFFPLFAKKSCRIATVSEFSKNDLINTYHIEPNKIDVVYNGANELYTPINSEEKLSTREKYAQGQQYFLYIGSLNPRKNINNLLLAFDEFKKRNKSGFKLILVGAAMHANNYQEVYNNMQFNNDVIFCGRMNTNELHHLLASAYALTYVPFFEGFGIPVLESMYCHVPVITSNVTSLPEVVGDAAILVDPSNYLDIADAMLRIVNDEALYNDLVNKSIKRKEEFSWDKTANLIWESIEQLLIKN